MKNLVLTGGEPMNQSETATAAKPRQADPLVKGKLAILWFEMKRNRVSYLFLAPFLILFPLFTIVPIVTSVFMSFTYYNILQSPKFIGLSNYKLLFVDDDIFSKSDRHYVEVCFHYRAGRLCDGFSTRMAHQPNSDKISFFLYALLLYTVDYKCGSHVRRMAVPLRRRPQGIVELLSREVGNYR